MNTPLNNEAAVINQPRKPLRKQRRSKLDPFTNELIEMEKDKVSLPEIVTWLDQRGLSTTAKNVPKFLTNRREEAELKEQQEQLRLRANKCTVFEEWFAKNPKPDLGTVIEMFKLLMMELAADKVTDPKLLNLADKLAGTAIRFVNAQSREAYRTRKLVMEEENHAEAKQARQARALELCLAKSKKYPEAAAAFQAAFDALDRAEGILA